jgi:hypothetical protein
MRGNQKQQHQRDKSGNSHDCDRFRPRQCNTEFQC